MLACSMLAVVQDAIARLPCWQQTVSPSAVQGSTFEVVSGMRLDTA